MRITCHPQALLQVTAMLMFPLCDAYQGVACA